MCLILKVVLLIHELYDIVSQRFRTNISLLFIVLVKFVDGIIQVLSSPSSNSHIISSS
jgi:uncharacterized membrane protein